jgi:hypothetical protein
MVQRRLLERIVRFCSSVPAGCRKTQLEANRLPAINRCAIVNLGHLGSTRTFFEIRHEKNGRARIHSLRPIRSQLGLTTVKARDPSWVSKHTELGLGPDLDSGSGPGRTQALAQGLNVVCYCSRFCGPCPTRSSNHRSSRLFSTRYVLPSAQEWERRGDEINAAVRANETQNHLVDPGLAAM